jgi:ArsR family transcriptional regulator, virulence genes transcriptional regulator
MVEVSVKQAARTFGALANPGRLRLLLTLASEQVCDVATLARLCDRSQPYISQQLRILRDHGLIVGQQCGQRVCYQLSGRHAEAVMKAAGLTWLPDTSTEAEVRKC